MVRVRALVVRAFFGAVIVVQLYFVVTAYGSPHKFFGYQPFNESSTWEADVYRVLRDGRRVPFEGVWAGYDWNQLVQGRGLYWPFHRRHASYGVDSTLDFFQKALDWVAANTPRDRETLRFEAEVRYWRNTRGPSEVTLRSAAR